jgi:RHH-type proline utilization regulon transcriptional repressor/proline dehydrogenase/delta 1-pyrroline-5-carboxylate dehydrogenase
MTDECFRSSSYYRVADQMIYLLNQYGIPKYLDWIKRTQLGALQYTPVMVAQVAIPLAINALRQETSNVILPAEQSRLTKHIQKRRAEGVRLNLNHLGEAILSEGEAKKRLHTYLEDLKHPDIDYVSVKISTLYSQINLLSWQETIEAIAKSLMELYRAAKKPTPRGEMRFVNLDMEEYRDLHLTVAVFRYVLEHDEFLDLPAGIVLQAYLPDSYTIQQELTAWAQKRVARGGAPIKIRIVKGANLAMEQVEASVKGWAQAPYAAKEEVDANYKRMVIYGCQKEHAQAVRIGVASHNLFDISFALLLRAENGVEPYVTFEMLEGMAPHMQRVVQKLTGDLLLYCPVASKEEFQHAIAYLIRRLDENTGPDNFLRHIFTLKPGSDAWEQQVTLFSNACDRVESVSAAPRRQQNRLRHAASPAVQSPFVNEADTDFSLSQNRQWAVELLHSWKQKKIPNIPLCIGGQDKPDNQEGVGINPSLPGHPLFQYAKGHVSHVEEALRCAKKHEHEWALTTVEQRSHLLAHIAQKLRERRGELIGAMMVNGGKTVMEADPEVSEAIDFAEYYRRRMEKLAAMRDLSWKPKGTVLVTSPWNFPCAIPAGGILAALVTGNCVIFKPASDTVLVAWQLVNAFWDAGVPKGVLQFLPCDGSDVGRHLIVDPRVNCVILTGGTSTAEQFLRIRPDLDLAAETGGKNSMIVTAMSDRDLVIKDLLHSAFSHSGQKCSATSLAILEAEVYDDLHFRAQLRDAAASLKVGPATDLSTKMGPLIRPPSGALKRALTTLEEGEEWLLEPRVDVLNPHLWTPGIKLGVKPGSFTHMTELFGPVLGIMRANNLDHAISLANAVPYGLTAGLQSLDHREQERWLLGIEAGNCYINRPTTGAVVQRQPFGGTKASSFGNGSKAGGPNYLKEFMRVTQVALPQEKQPVNEEVNELTSFLDKITLTADQLGLWTASIAHYAYWWKRLCVDQDPAKLLGQDNFFHYVSRKRIVIRVGTNLHPLDVLRACAAALTCGATFEVSWSAPGLLNWVELAPMVSVVEESEINFQERVRKKQFDRIRLIGETSSSLREACAESATYLIDAPVLVNGRLELLHFLREVAISADYHRYGNLGLREGELRNL